MKRLLRSLSGKSKARENTGLKAHHLLHQIADAINARRCFLLTAPTTGKRLLDNLSISKFETLVSVKYSPEIDRQNGRGMYQSLADALSGIGKGNKFDISFVDPYHGYEESCLAIEESIACLNDAGWMVLHDCFPPYELTADIFQEGAWCGSTYAAFRDVAIKGDRAWFVLDADFGLGILGPKNSFRIVEDAVDASLSSAWELADLESKRALFKTSGRELMRVISPDKIDEALRMLTGKQPFKLDEL